MLVRAIAVHRPEVCVPRRPPLTPTYSESHEPRATSYGKCLYPSGYCYPLIEHLGDSVIFVPPFSYRAMPPSPSLSPFSILRFASSPARSPCTISWNRSNFVTLPFSPLFSCHVQCSLISIERAREMCVQDGPRSVISVDYSAASESIGHFVSRK